MRYFLQDFVQQLKFNRRKMRQKELCKEFVVLRDQAIILRQTFNTFNCLFASSPEVDDTLRKSAVLFFYDLNQILIEYIILLICRITDPPKTHHRANLTIPRMTKLVCEGNDLDLDIQADIKSNIEDLDRQIGDYRRLLNPVRNRIVSHNDREAYVLQQTLGEHTEGEMIQFFDNLQKYFDEVGNAIGIGPLDFQYSAARGDVQDLVKILGKQ